MRARLLSVVLSLVVVVGCSSVSERPGTDAAAPVADAAVTPVDAAVVVDAYVAPDATMAPDAFVAPDAGPAPSFDSIYTSILVPRCGRCHIEEGGVASYYRPRLPDVDAAYTALFDVPAATDWVRFCVPDGVTAYRVRPFDPSTSMLAFLPTCYVRDAQHDELTAEELAQIRAWIEAGAPREPF